jgi:hypothetical protein
MNHPRGLSMLFLIGVLTAGSTALGYYYYYVYEPPLATAEAFIQAMERRDEAALKRLILVSPDSESVKLRLAKAEEVKKLLSQPFRRGRILDQDKRSGPSGIYDFLIYRQPNGTIYALKLVARPGESFKIIIPEHPQEESLPYLWDYTWTN